MISNAVINVLFFTLGYLVAMVTGVMLYTIIVMVRNSRRRELEAIVASMKKQKVVRRKK